MITNDSIASLTKPDNLEVPVELLCYQDGSSIWAATAPYYADFIAFLLAPVRNRATFRARLLADEAGIAQTQFRAASIVASRKLGVGYDEARNLVEFMSIRIDPEAAADIVLDNYLAMARGGEVFAIFAVVDSEGRYIVIEGLHRLSINIANGRRSCPLKILRRD